MLILKILLSITAIVFFVLQFVPKFSNYSIIMVNISAFFVLLYAIADPISMYIINNKSSFSFPSLSTFSGYNERLILTNYSNSKVSYNIIFTVGSSSKAISEDKAGEIAPKSHVVLKTTEMISIAGTTNFSALVNIAAPPSLVDASVSKVNLDNGEVNIISPNKK
jgi:hypothetical protein